MQLFKHYSFDLWLTLIKSNPCFKSERAKYFYKHLNRFDKTLEEISTTFRRVDLLCSAINEKTGGNITAEEQYLMVISEINNHSISFYEIDLEVLCYNMDGLLWQYLPKTYCTATIPVLETIKEKSSISLLSNTGFIKGKTLRLILHELGLEKYFDFQLYSDEVGMSKPNHRLFELMANRVADTRHPEPILLREILHVGDNQQADVAGANALGISVKLINSNNHCISTLLN